MGFTVAPHRIESLQFGRDSSPWVWRGPDRLCRRSGVPAHFTPALHWGKGRAAGACIKAGVCSDVTALRRPAEGERQKSGGGFLPYLSLPKPMKVNRVATPSFTERYGRTLLLT